MNSCQFPCRPRMAHVPEIARMARLYRAYPHGGVCAPKKPWIAYVFGGRHRNGFALYLVFVVTTILFFLALGSLDIAKAAVDMGRSGTLDVVGFHAADGGLEIGLSRLRKQFIPFSMKYSTKPDLHREVLVFLQTDQRKDGITLTSSAEIREGNKCVARRSLVRRGITEGQGRGHDGEFAEIPPIGQANDQTRGGS